MSNASVNGERNKLKMAAQISNRMRSKLFGFVLIFKGSMFLNWVMLSHVLHFDFVFYLKAQEQVLLAVLILTRNSKHQKGQVVRQNGPLLFLSSLMANILLVMGLTDECPSTCVEGAPMLLL